MTLYKIVYASLPLVGVRIEIISVIFILIYRICHSPWWECGLKSEPQDLYESLAVSLPLVGVRIEISEILNSVRSTASHSPWWECGLKCAHTIWNTHDTRVTPLGGSAD